VESQLGKENSATTAALRYRCSSAQSAVPKVLLGRISVVAADQGFSNSVDISFCRALHNSNSAILKAMTEPDCPKV
jgi:hypothetical protein